MSADFADVKKAVSDGGAIIIDVRNPDELKSAGKIPNSVNLPLPDIPDALRLSESAFRSRFGFARPGDHQAVIVHCKSGVRAAKAAGLLTAAGFYNMRIYKGSFSDWVSQGGEVKK